MCHDIDGGAFLHRKQLNCSLRNPRRIGGVRKHLCDGKIRAQRIGTAAQENGVPGFQTEADRICRHVRTSFVDHTDDTKRHAHTTDLKPVRTAHRIVLSSQRVRECGGQTKPFCHRGNTRLVKTQTIQIGSTHPGCFGILHICCVFMENFVSVCHQGICHGTECFVACVRPKCCEAIGCCLCCLCLRTNLLLHHHEHSLYHQNHIVPMNDLLMCTVCHKLMKVRCSVSHQTHHICGIICCNATCDLLSCGTEDAHCLTC